MNRRMLSVVGVAAVAAVALTACAAADKAGGDTIVLKLATIDGDVDGVGNMIGGAAFVEKIGEVSGGRISVEVMTTYADAVADNEVQLVEAIASGEVDGGWPGVRSFASAGITGLEPLEAPLTITSTAAQVAVIDGPAGELALESLEGTGIHGLTLLPGALRRPFANGEAIVTVSDWQGQSFRVFPSTTQDATIDALGADPVRRGLDWFDHAQAGEIRGADFDIAGYNNIGLGKAEAGNVTANVVLWPKMMALVLSQERWESLTAEQRTWVQEAAEQARQASVVHEFAATEQEAIKGLCARGVTFTFATDEELEELQAAVRPVVDALRADGATAELMSEVLEAAADTEPEVPTVPDDCGRVSNAIPASTAPIPDGVYRAEITEQDAREMGVSNDPGNSGIWTLTVRDGQYGASCRPLDRPGWDCGRAEFSEGVPYDAVLEAGHLRGDDREVWIVYDPAVHLEWSGWDCEADCPDTPAMRFDWTVTGDVLTLTDPSGASQVQWAINPWVKIA